jgi:hypothetical protein
MRPQRIALWILVPSVGGMVLLWTGLLLAAAWVRFAIDHRFFGLSGRHVLAVDDYVVWGVVALVIGFVVGALLRSKPVVAALATCAASALLFMASAHSDDLSFVQVMSFYVEPLIASLVFVTLGALLASRVLRPNKSLERTRGR